MSVSRDTANNPETLYACPRCDYLRDSPADACDGCDYDPAAIVIEADDDRDLDRPSPIVRVISASIGIGMCSLILLMGLAGVFGDPDRVNRGIVRLLSMVLG